MSQHNIVPRLAISAALGGLLYGYDTAVINGATTVIKEHFHTGDAVLGLAVGSALITGCVGALLSGRIADKIGRVPMMKIAAVCFLVCGVGCAFAPNIEILVAFRVFGGFAAASPPWSRPCTLLKSPRLGSAACLALCNSSVLCSAFSSLCWSTHCSCISVVVPAR